MSSYYTFDVITPVCVWILQIPDGDLLHRRCGQKMDPVTGEIYTMEVYNPEKKITPVSRILEYCTCTKILSSSEMNWQLIK